MSNSAKLKLVDDRPPDLETLAESRCEATIAAAEAFFDAHADRLAALCLEMARRFHRGGRLLAFGTGACATDAQHVAVEFLHPVIAGNRALPAVALCNDVAMLTDRASGLSELFSRQIEAFAAPQDIALGISCDMNCFTTSRALGAAQQRGLLALHLCGSGNPEEEAMDWQFLVPSDDRFVVQEVHETACHVLWELVHVFLGHPELLAAASTLRLADPDEADHEHQRLLYPFLSEAEGNASPQPVLEEVRESMLSKHREVCDLRRQVIQRHRAELLAGARAMAIAIEAGGRLLTFGNGGSATDAADLAADFNMPPDEQTPPLPAMTLTNDSATITALANDVGLENSFLRQIIALGRPGDIAVGISTSGNSANVLAAFEAARKIGMIRIALAGYDGGRCAELARAGVIDHLFTVPCQHIPRIQEAQATVYHVLYDLLHHHLARGAR